MIQQKGLRCAACTCNLGSLAWIGLLDERRIKHRLDVGGSVRLDPSLGGKIAIVSPNSLAEADFALQCLILGVLCTFPPIQARKKRCKVWKQVSHVRENGLLVGVQTILYEACGRPAQKTTRDVKRT